VLRKSRGSRRCLERITPTRESMAAKKCGGRGDGIFYLSRVARILAEQKKREETSRRVAPDQSGVDLEKKKGLEALFGGGPVRNTASKKFATSNRQPLEDTQNSSTSAPQPPSALDSLCRGGSVGGLHHRGRPARTVEGCPKSAGGRRLIEIPLN